MASTRCKIEGAIFVILVIIGVGLWIMDIAVYSAMYRNAGITSQEEYKPEPNLPFPMIMLCPQSVVNTSSEMVKANGVYNFRYPEGLTYLSEVLNPSTAPLTSTENIVTKALEVMLSNKNNNKSAIEQMLISCHSMVQSCSIRGFELNATECCEVSTYLPTPRGICLGFQFKDVRQKKPGSLNGIKMSIQIRAQDQNPRMSTVKSNEIPPVHLYLHGADGFRAEDMQEYIILEDEVSYEVGMSMVKRFDRTLGRKCRSSFDLENIFNPYTKEGRHRKRVLQSEQDTYKECLIGQIRKKCDCDPLLALWSDPVPQNFTLCALNVTRMCAKPILDQWTFVPEFTEEVEEMSDKCRRKLKCQSVQWQTNVQMAKGLNQAGYQADFNIFYDRFRVKMIQSQWSMSAEDLLHWIAFAGCVWFVICFIIFHFSKGLLGCCMSEKTEQQVTPVANNNPAIYLQPMTGVVPEKYQTTQTD